MIVTANELRILDAIRGKISEGKPLSDILDAVFQYIGNIVPCDRLDIGLIEENGQRMEICHSAASDRQKLVSVGYVEDIESPLLQQAFHDKSGSISNNLHIYEIDHDTAGLAQLLISEGIHSCIVTPVILHAEIIGVLLCGSKSIDLYSEHHAFILSEVAKSLSRVVENVYLHVLIEQNHQAYLEMLSFVTHELKSPLSSIITLGRTMVEGYYGRIDEKQRDILGRMIKKAEYLHSVGNRYLNLSRLESGNIEFHPQLVDFIDDVVEPAIDLLAPQIEERKVRFEKDYRNVVFPVHCDPDLVKIVLLNLLSNGIRYGNRGGSLKISLGREYKQFSASVWNEGPGFSERDKHLLYLDMLLVREFLEITVDLPHFTEGSAFLHSFSQDHQHRGMVLRKPPCRP